MSLKGKETIITARIKPSTGATGAARLGPIADTPCFDGAAVPRKISGVELRFWEGPSTKYTFQGSKGNTDATDIAKNAYSYLSEVQDLL